MLNTAIFAILLTALSITAGALYKIRRVHIMMFRVQADLDATRSCISQLEDIRTDIRNLYGQIQAYQDLNRLIQPTLPLPLLRGWAASPDFLLEICRYSLRHRPNLVVECSSGASTLVLARCCELCGQGHVRSLEHDPLYAEKTRQELIDHNLHHWATVIDAPLVELPDGDGQRWYSLANLDIGLQSCELLVIDGPPADTMPQARYPAIPNLLPFLAQNCAVFLDDADRTDERITVERWLQEFPDFESERGRCEKGCVKLVRKAAQPVSSPAPNPLGRVV